jgi:hypothetical protein
MIPILASRARLVAACLLAGSLPIGCVSERSGGVVAPDARPFVAMARQADCADRKNRLFVIDDSLVFWDKAGQCADAAYAQTLFGATPQSVLCRYADSIAGPRRECPDPRYQSMFDTIIAHADEPDLGLGPRHTVRPIPL